jgi:hypothetical protein
MPNDSPVPASPPGQRWLISLPLLIAVLTLCASMFQSWNYARNIESAQRNILRSESLRTCRDIIDAFFQFRLKAEEANAMRQSAPAMAGPEMKAIVYKFGAYGTFLANFQGEAARKLYTELSWDLLAIADGAVKLSPEDFAKRFAAADEKFGKLNEDCVKAAQSKLL